MVKIKNNYVRRIKKKVIKKWVFEKGYEMCLQLVRKEHDNIFLNLGDENGIYNEQKMNRLQELSESIHYITMLKNIGAHQLSFFK